MASPIPPDVKRCVVFLYAQGAEGKSLPSGTGFLVAAQHPTDTQKAYPYIVTAGHVLKQADGSSFLPEIAVRMNLKQGGVEYVRIPLVTSGVAKNVYTPSDPTVDLAVIPFLPDQIRHDFRFIPEGFLPTSEELRTLPVHEGAEVFFTGLFVQHVSDHANIPIVRFGRVAFAADEPVSWLGTTRHLLLIESSSYGGNSGAPVFYYLGADREPGSLIVGSPLLKLAGVMMGAYQDVKPVAVVNTSQVAVATSNLGIAAVVPVSQLRDLLFGAELVSKRANAP